MKTMTKDQILKAVADKAFVCISNDCSTARLAGYDGFYFADEPTKRNLEALLKAGKIVCDKHGDYFLAIDYAPMKIDALQTEINRWALSRQRDHETYTNVIRFTGFPRCDTFGKDQQSSENNYVIDPDCRYLRTIWAPDVNPMAYTDNEIHAEALIQNAERAIAAIEYAANVAARKAYFARLADL